MPIRTAITLCLAVLPAALRAQGATASAVEARVATLRDADAIRLYQARQYAPLWLDDAGRLNPSGRDALGLLRHAADHGLDSLLYDVSRLDDLQARLAASADPAITAETDVAVTAALLRYLRDLRQGRARPATIAKDTTAPDLATAMAQAVTADSLAALARAMAPPFRQYQLLQAALARERATRPVGVADTAGARRIERLSLALERLRWAPRITQGRMIIVNVPAFELLALDAPGGAAHAGLRSRVVVGDADRSPTPLLFETMTMVEFWPYWNVPRSIVLGEILPGLRRNPGYLQSRKMEVVNSREQVMGDLGTPELLAGLTDGRYFVRQRPSRANALGVVKFLFPNSASVYAHDTPNREYFGEARRDFSHGCIRVEEAASLAAWVLADEPDWTRDKVQAALRGPTTRRVTLRHPIPVLIVYTTAVAAPDGSVRYVDDLYGLDRPLAAALRRR
jgi:murein L,D-transpeptidase YcbB/YkuD